MLSAERTALCLTLTTNLPVVLLKLDFKVEMLNLNAAVNKVASFQNIQVENQTNANTVQRPDGSWTTSQSQNVSRLSDEKSADLGELTLEQVSQSDRMYKSEWVNELKQRARDRKVKKRWSRRRERSQHGGELPAQTTSALNLPGTTGVSHT